MAYELRPHTADVGVAAHGESLAEVFSAIGDGLAACMCESWPDHGERFGFSLTAESREAALFDYLDELIYQRDTREVLPVDHQVEIEQTEEGWQVDASYRGVPLSDVTARDIKAVTYSDMEITRTAQGWSAYVVFDV